MVGQSKLKNQIKSLSKYPHFSILSGPRGSGKKEMASWIASECLNCPVVFLDCKIDSIRKLIDTSFVNSSKIVYAICDGDSMSNAAKNSLLKISEETPKNIYLILLLRDLMNTLATIKSRAITFSLDLYTKEDLLQYCNLNTLTIPQEILIACDNINDLLIYNKDPSIWNYTDKVIRNIEKVSLANSFKIGNSLSLKKESEGYDLELFWKFLCYKCYMLLSFDSSKYGSGIRITSNYLSKLVNPNFNRVYLFDMWILDMRKSWEIYNEN